jgi:hypothetical protein
LSLAGLVFVAGGIVVATTGHGDSNLGYSVVLLVMGPVLMLVALALAFDPARGR